MVLRSYHYSDDLATLGRLATLLSILGSYPLLFSGLASSTLDMLGVSFNDHPVAAQRRKDVLAVLTVLSTTMFAMKFRDLGFITSILGAIQGSLLIYILPAIMHLRVLDREGKLGWSINKIGSVLIVVMGSLLGLLGCVVSSLEKFTDIFAR